MVADIFLKLQIVRYEPHLIYTNKSGGWNELLYIRASLSANYSETQEIYKTIYKIVQTAQLSNFVQS